MKRLLLLLCLTLAPITSQALTPGEMFADPEKEARAREIGRQLRCLVCQNESIFDSNAGLAKELQVIVRERMELGEGDTQIVDYVTDKYGDYVLLKPRVGAQTYVLWAAPFALLLFGGIGVLARAQAQDFAGVIDLWAALAADSNPNDPCMGMVRRDIVNMARFLNVDVTNYLPDATPTEVTTAGSTPPAPENLAVRIADAQAAVDADPKDYRAWTRLITLQAQSGETDAAIAALDDARQQFGAAPFLLQRFDAIASSLGLDLAQGDVRGPMVGQN